MTDWFWAGVGLSTLLLFVGHWFPWPRGLNRLTAYVYGVLSIYAGAVLWLLQSGHPEIVVGLGVIIGISGAAVFLSYGIDWLVVQIHKAEKGERLVDDGRTE
jgi:hypothetical protein